MNTYTLMYTNSKIDYLLIKEQFGGSNECDNDCGRAKAQNAQGVKFDLCCPICKNQSGPHTSNCDKKNPMCKNGCGRHANSGKNYSTCCNACTGLSLNNNHTSVCNARNNPLHIVTPTIISTVIPTVTPTVTPILHPVHRYEFLILDNNIPIKKSATLDQTSNLYKILSQIQGYLQNIQGSGYQPPHGGKFHVEIVNNEFDKSKQGNFNLLQNKQIDLCASANWQCYKGAFSLIVGSPLNPLDYNGTFHVTIGYYGGSKCVPILATGQNAVESVLKRKLH